MNEDEQREIVDGYLRRLATGLEGVPAGARQELIEDVRSHIAEAWESEPEHNRAALLNLLERLGRPEELAREERERLGIAQAPQSQGAGALSVAAIVFMVLFWPLGVLFSWISSRWSAGDKAVATIIPAFGLFLGLLMSMALFTTTGVAVTREVTVGVQGEAQPGPEAVRLPEQTVGIGVPLRALAGRILAFFGFLGAPLTSAAYLSLRLGRGTRRRATLIPVAAGVLVGVGILVLLLAPMDSHPGRTLPAPRPASSIEP